MSGWKLDPAGIQGVLQGVNAEAEGLGTDLVGTAEAPADHGDVIFTGLSGGLELTGPVLQAVNDAMTYQSANINAISYRITAGLLGVTNATIAYNQGNEDMAASFQDAMGDAALHGDFSFFERFGVV